MPPMEERGRLLGGLVMLVLAVVAIGCGDDASTGAGSEGTTTEERPYPNVTGPGREFLIPGGDNLVQTFGEGEASAAEREEASRVIHVWMKARVAEDWATDCKYLAREYIKQLVADARGVSEGKAKNCVQTLEFFGDAASGTSGNTLTGPIDSLRVRDTIEGNTEKEGVAQWHGPNQIDWVLPLRREGGAWKVAIASPLDRNK
jgi:hypothetical protein